MKPNNPFLSYPLSSKDQHICIKYANDLAQYSNDLEYESQTLKEWVQELFNIWEVQNQHDIPVIELIDVETKIRNKLKTLIK